jgi:hypothetical protein
MLQRPRQQSGQEHIRSAYEAIKRLRRNENELVIKWILRTEENELFALAKQKVRKIIVYSAILPE